MIDTGGGLDRLHISPQSNPPVPEDGKEKHSLSFIHDALSKRFVFQITHTMEKQTKHSSFQTKGRRGKLKTLFKYLFTCNNVQKGSFLLSDSVKIQGWLFFYVLNHGHLRLFLQQWNIYDIKAIGVFLSCTSFAGHMRCLQLVPHWRQAGSRTGWCLNDRLLPEIKPHGRYWSFRSSSWLSTSQCLKQYTIPLSTSQSLYVSCVVFRRNTTWKYVKNK